MPGSVPTVFDKVRQSCSDFLDTTDLVKINDEKLKEFAKNISADEAASAELMTHLPIKFSSMDHEINTYALMHILNFASGFRHELHAAAGRGAFETIVYGLMSLSIQGNPLDANSLLQLTLHDIATNFGFPISKEKQIATGVYMEEPTELRKLAELILRTLNEVGIGLQRLGMQRMSQFILTTIKPAQSASDPNLPLAAPLVEALAANFPAFNDRVTIDGKDVILLKKAQLLCADFKKRFAERDPLHFDFKDIKHVTIFADNVLPAMLRQMRVIELRPDLLARIEARESLPAAGPEHTALRAAAVVAGDRIIKELGGSMSTSDLDGYLWQLGKKGDLRKVERHSTKDTAFY